MAIVGLIIRVRTMESFVFEQLKTQTSGLKYPASQVWREMPLTILRTSLVNAMFGGAFFADSLRTGNLVGRVAS